MLIIDKIQIVSPNQPIQYGCIVIEDNTIRDILPSSDTLSNIKKSHVIDGTNLIAVPGFIDLQINGGFGMDFTQDPETIWKVAEQLPQFGVTSFLPTIITSPIENVEHARDVLLNKRPDGFHGAEPLGLHVEGPFLSEHKKGTHNTAHFRDPSPDIVENWSPETGVQLVTLAPERPGALETITKLVRNHVVVSAGHSNATFDEALAGFAAGISYSTHLFNAMSPLHHRDPGLVGAALTIDDITIGLILDGIHTHPVLTEMVWRLKGNKRLTLVTDAMAALGMSPGDYVIGDFDVVVDEISARRPDGTLAGSILSLDTALRNLIQYAHLDLCEAIPTITSTPANLIKRPDIGRITAGSDADIVLLNQKLEVQQTIIKGKIGQ
jgi:N-acetylglucosamine-6-phosphate deacetylase